MPGYVIVALYNIPRQCIEYQEKCIVYPNNTLTRDSIQCDYTFGKAQNHKCFEFSKLI